MTATSRVLAPLATLLVVGLFPLSTKGDDAAPAFAGGKSMLTLDNGLVVQGRDVQTPDGYTSGFRVTAGFTPAHLPRLDLGAEISYRESDDVPVARDGDQQLLDTTSLGGSLVAGLRLGNFGLYAKSGFAEWQGDPEGRASSMEAGGTARVQGFGVRWQGRRFVTRLETEEIDAPTMAHLNLVTASIHYPF
ncbi:hypothetical protein [Halomonas cerina]|uniref:Outer membrane protein beta-barrel domain-containing protein n=1 Tax=Halomonas cerina TaxID=447424 RepID=A0A839VED8_9GAMM|nr:hypothetical protein [Halomonas cerina]MBB3191057.1 hypothetical protein [Halomonas cerina]